MPTVTMMVGGIDKQIYLPYQLAQGLGYYKKYGVSMQLSTEQSGGVGAETAMASGQVDMAGAWYVHTIDFQLAHKDVIDVAQLSGAPGEREMCYQGSGITSPAQWRGKTVGVTDLGSGTDDLTLYLAARYHLTSKDFTRVAAGDGDTMVSALQHHRIVCGMTTQPTVTAIEKGRRLFRDRPGHHGRSPALAGRLPADRRRASPGRLGEPEQGHRAEGGERAGRHHALHRHAQRGPDRRAPARGLRLELADHQGRLHPRPDHGQGPVPAEWDDAATGPQTVYAVEKLAGKITGPVNLSTTYTNSYVIKANKLEGFTR